MKPILQDKCPRSFRSAPRWDAPIHCAERKDTPCWNENGNRKSSLRFQLSIERFNLYFDSSRSRIGPSVLSSDSSFQMKLRSSVILRSISSPGITTLLVMRSRESLWNWEYLTGYSVCEQGVHCMAYVIESVCVCKYWFEQQSAVLAWCRIFLTDFP